MTAAFSAIYKDIDKLRVVLKSLHGNATKLTEQWVVTLGKYALRGGSKSALPIPALGFHQLDGPASGRYEGTGIGPYMTEELTQLSDATVTVTTQADYGAADRV